MARVIGILAEKSLHAALKAYYAQPGDLLECDLNGYVIDIVRALPDDALLNGAESRHCIEIQTRGLGKMKRKLSALLDQHTVQVVHPIAHERTITRINADGEIVSRRKSPKRGTVFDIFPELVSLPTLIQHPNLHLEALLIREEQIWLDDGQGSWRRKHWSISDRRLVEVVAAVPLHTLADFAALLPADLPPLFDTQELAKLIHQPRSTAQKMAFCLREMGVIEITAKRGHALLYRITS